MENKISDFKIGKIYKIKAGKGPAHYFKNGTKVTITCKKKTDDFGWVLEVVSRCSDSFVDLMQCVGVNQLNKKIIK